MTFEQDCEPLSSRVPGQQLDLTANTGGQMKRIYIYTVYSIYIYIYIYVCESHHVEMLSYGVGMLTDDRLTGG